MCKFTLRLPDELRREIKVAAAKQDMSMNVWLVEAAQEKLQGYPMTVDQAKIDIRQADDLPEMLEALETWLGRDPKEDQDYFIYREREMVQVTFADENLDFTLTFNRED